jgi:hypothetical protein
VLAGHNLPFDVRMIAAEFQRIGVEGDFGTGLDTLQVTRCKLPVACERYRVNALPGHHALKDARATAQLLACVLASFTGPTVPAKFLSTVPPRDPDSRCPRSPDAHQVLGPPTWLGRVAASLEHDADGNLLNYLDLLDRAMADLHFDDEETAQLRLLASDLGLDEHDTARAHRRWLDDYLQRACADGKVDEDEYDELSRAAAVLGLAQGYVDAHTSTFRTGSTTVSLAACTVCFTGEPVDVDGFAIPRSRLEAHARSLGLEPVPTVTRARCDLLVAADPHTRSGKAEKARTWGIPIVAATAFLEATVGTELPARQTTVHSVKAMVCADCGRSWTVLRMNGRRAERCDECSAVASRRQPKSLAKAGRRAHALGTAELVGIRTRADGSTTEVFRCLACEKEFERTPGPGRKPKLCQGCR